MDDPCTARLRLCGLIAYLRGHGHRELYLAARRLMPVIFHPKDLSKKIKEGQWGDGAFYVNSFAPFSESGKEARLLMQFLIDFRALDSFARNGSFIPGSYFWNWLGSMYKKPVLSKYPCFAIIVQDVVSKRDGHARVFLDWQLVRNKAAKLAVEMAHKTPELRGRMLGRRGRSDLYHLPVGPRCCVKKSFGTKQPAALAHYYLQMKKRLPSTSQGSNHNDSTVMLHGESLQKMLHGEPLIALFETSLQAGRHSIAKDRRPPHLPKEGGWNIQGDCDPGVAHDTNMSFLLN